MRVIHTSTRTDASSTTIDSGNNTSSSRVSESNTLSSHQDLERQFAVPISTMHTLQQLTRLPIANASSHVREPLSAPHAVSSSTQVTRMHQLIAAATRLGQARVALFHNAHTRSSSLSHQQVSASPASSATVSSSSNVRTHAGHRMRMDPSLSTNLLSNSASSHSSTTTRMNAIRERAVARVANASSMSTPFSAGSVAQPTMRRRNAVVDISQNLQQMSPLIAEAAALMNQFGARTLTGNWATRTGTTRNSSRSNGPITGSGTVNPSIHPQFRSKTVCKIFCRHCSLFMCKRGMRAILLGNTEIELFSTDVPPTGVQLVYQDYVTHNCSCRIRDAACLGCGNIVGYHVTQPCERCLEACNNGHFWMFLSDGVSATERLDAAGKTVLSWAMIPSNEVEKDSANSIIDEVMDKTPAASESDQIQQKPDESDTLVHAQKQKDVEEAYSNVEHVSARKKQEVSEESSDVQLCPITGLPATMTDSRTGIACASAEAMAIIQRVADGVFGWSQAYRCFIHASDERPPAEVPHGWIDCSLGRPFVVPEIEPSRSHSNAPAPSTETKNSDHADASSSVNTKETS